MPSIKTLTSIILVTITVRIITIILTRTSKPVEVHAVEGVYTQFFGENNPPLLDMLTLSNGALRVECSKARGWRVSIESFSGRVKQECEGRGEMRIPLPPEGVEGYHVRLSKGEEQILQMYALVTPRVGDTPLQQTVLRLGEIYESSLARG